MCLTIVLIAVAGRVLLGGRGDRGIQWLVIHYLASNVTLLWVALGVPALLAGYTLADALTGSIGLGSASANGAAVAGDEHQQHPDDIPDNPDASAPGAALDKRPCAAVATRPTSGLDRAAGAQGRQLLHARLRRRTDDGSSRSGAGRCCGGWSATVCCIP